ncbi:hypothetical protein AC578_1708 [Pseudocercospora eumusae]|uniref:Rad60/SUMO-like domain-containing protein n=1 Tax=Pseudocercospora eumusae TaxID=321146 RepID=A0A139GV10_9PEZI|nr:hypothetical protein AC578_1708 [Pseudocercospora eumusae]
MAVITPEGTPSPAQRADDTSANTAQQSVESEAQPKPDRLTITFRDFHGYELVFKLKSTTKMGKVMVSGIP